MSSIIESYKDLIYTIEQAIPFNRVLGIHLEEVTEENVTLSFEMRPDLVGNFGDSRLHGGVISAAIDVVGGMAALVAVLGRIADHEGALAGFRKLGTIDLRVDYLRPGVGKKFFCHGHVIRAGGRVAVVRMEFVNDEDLEIAVGTATYIVG
ncbi:Uncharacterized protein YigI [hydrothermal vent metagenome]|uniref:Uncharacterized protein YigI n=1 Tax=hydrothermal vent metagenome TaxID=652676 RepID=A0A3B0S9Q5_9ZZZZ